MIVPAYNEKECIANTVRSLAAERPPDRDHRRRRRLDRRHRRRSSRRCGLPERAGASASPTRGKPAALNTGIAHARHDIDRDGGRRHRLRAGHRPRSWCSPSPTRRSARSRATPRSATATALIGAWQHIEYVIGFNLDRRMYDVLRCMPTIPGAIGAFRREALLDGRRHERRHPRRGHRPHHGAAPGRLAGGLRGARPRLDRGAGHAAAAVAQRYRWCYGTMQAMWKHRRAADRPRARRAASAGSGCRWSSLFQVVAAAARPADRRVPAVRPALPRPGQTLAGLAGVLAVSCSAPRTRSGWTGRRYRTCWSLPLQQFVYRQLMYLVLLQSCDHRAHRRPAALAEAGRTGEVEAPRTPEAVR